MTRVGIGVLLAAAIAAAAFLFLREPPTPGRSPGSVSAEAARRDVEPDEPEERRGPVWNAASRTDVGAPPGARGPFVRGHVVDRGGAPVNHAAVRLELTSPEQGPDYATAGAFDLRVPVDADGAFCVPVPLHARFIVTAAAKGFAPAAKAQVSSGDDVELVLDAPARLAGRVAHLGTRQPLAGAKLELRVPGIPHPREATTGADGAYAFDDLPPVVATVETRLAGFVIDRADADLASGAVWREVALDPGLSVAGRVVAAESGLPLEGVRVRSFWTEPGVLTDARGAFGITGLWPGSWNLHTRVKGRSDGAAHVILSKDRTPEDVLISVRVSREISGVVVDQDGRPVAGATVEAGADPVVTQADGRFVVDHEFEVDADSMQIHSRVRATREGLTPVSQEVELKPDGARDVTLRLVPADVTIAGLVQDAAGRPVEGVRVICQAEPRGRVAGTDANGRFVFERSQRADEYRLWASAPGYLERELDLQRPGESTALETTITLAEPRRIHVTGNVVDDTGEAIPGARLEVRSSEGVIGTGEAAPDGRFDIVAFQSKPEPADITASAAGYGRSGIGIDCREPVSQFTFRLCRLGRIRGRVVDAATGEAVRGAEIVLRVEDGCDAGYGGRTAETPDFSFEAPPGAFEIRIDADRYARATRRIDVASHATIDVGTIELRHGGAIEGVIRRASGPSRTLSVVLASGGRSSLRWAGSTDSLGWFHLDGLAPGTWEVFGADESSRYWSSGGGQLVHLCSFGTVEVGDRTVARIDGRMAAPATLTVSSGDPSASGKPAEFSMDGPDSAFSRWRDKEEKRTDPYFHLSIRSIEGLPLSHSSLGVSPAFSGWWQGTRFDASIGPLPPGRYRVSLSSEGRGPVDSVVDLAAGEDRKVVLALPPATPAPAAGK